MRLRFRHFKYIIYTVLAMITVLLWLYALLNGASVVDWTIQSQNGFFRVWNYAISREGTVSVTGGMAVIMLVTILVDRRREKGIERRRTLREGVLKRRIQQAKDRDFLVQSETPVKSSSEVTVTEEERQIAKHLADWRGGLGKIHNGDAIREQLGEFMNEGGQILKRIEGHRVTVPYKEQAEGWAERVMAYLEDVDMKTRAFRFGNEAMMHSYPREATANTRQLFDWLYTRIVRLDEFIKELD